MVVILIHIAPFQVVMPLLLYSYQVEGKLITGNKTRLLKANFEHLELGKYKLALSFMFSLVSLVIPILFICQFIYVFVFVFLFRYGEVSPRFFIGSLKDAVNESVNNVSFSFLLTK